VVNQVLIGIIAFAGIEEVGKSFGKMSLGTK